MISKTLDDKLIIGLSTSGMVPGYVLTTLYANGIGVFKGRTYLKTANETLKFCLNDIVKQNRGNDDYLKLNDEGEVETLPLVDDTWSSVPYQYRFKRGQCGKYGVQIEQNVSGTNVYTNDYLDVLSAYHYPNKDLKCHCMDPISGNSTSLDRIMQGTDWLYDHDTEAGDFKNLLLPHYPKILTRKFGFGLQLYTNEATINPNLNYALHRKLGYDLKLGSPVFGKTSMTFLNLYDLIAGTYYDITSEYLDEDEYVWLKQNGTSGDEFGDWEEGFTFYKLKLKVYGFDVQRKLKTESTWEAYGPEWIHYETPETDTLVHMRNIWFANVLEFYVKKAKTQLPASQYNNVNEWPVQDIKDYFLGIQTGDQNYGNTDKFIAKLLNSQNTSTLSTYRVSYSNFYKTNWITFNLPDKDWPYNVNSGPFPVESDTEKARYDYRIRIAGPSNTYGIMYNQDYNSQTYEYPDMFYGTCPVAILDKCYARYYLAWYDRYGDVQSQAFDGKMTFNEEFETEEIQDYLERREISNVSITPKWTLNTKWLSEAIYPIYESIFSSPYLLLYDTEQDKSWNVIVTDKKYKEKTHKSEKTLFNLEINVEANENQNLIY